MAVIRKKAGLSRGSFLWKGEVFAYAGHTNPEDLEALATIATQHFAVIYRGTSLLRKHLLARIVGRTTIGS